MIRLALAMLMTGLTACQAQTVAATVWQLAQIDGTPYSANATLTIAPDSRVSGRAPCNSYAGGSGAQYPAFDARRLRATKRACPSLRAETAYFQALAAMQTAKRDGDRLILRGDGRQMVFTASE
ncbi:MAG: META domain-containing protein [Pseudomonadota bacterium]